MSLKSVNLNLLPVLRELLRLRSVSAAGRALGRSPSAISEGLSQLRLTFDDPLLVRTQGRMVLTPRALELADPVETLCAQMEGLLETGRFDPMSSVRLFTIAAHDYHVFSLGPGLIALFRHIAPGFTLRFVDLGHDLAQHLAIRKVDFAIMPDFHLGDLAPLRLVHLPLTQDHTVVLMREGHDLASLRHVDRAALTRHEQIAFHPNWEPVDYRKAIGAFRRNMRIRSHLAQITTLPFFIVDTDYISLVPQRLAERVCGPLRLTWRLLEDGQPLVKSVLAWSQVQDADPAHRWFRSRVATHDFE